MLYLVASGVLAACSVFSLLVYTDNNKGVHEPAWALASTRQDIAQALIALRTKLYATFPSLGQLKVSQKHEGSVRDFEQSMPELLDVLSLGLSAGLSFDASLELYCTRSHTPLSRELAQTMSIWQMGLESRSGALNQLSCSINSLSLRRFCSSVSEALSFGMPLSGTLEHQADLMREEQRSRTQERIEEVPVRMLIPLGLLVVPAMLLAILGPLLSASI